MNTVDEPTAKPETNPPATEQNMKAFLDSYLELALQIWYDRKANPERYGLFQKWSEEKQVKKVASENSASGPEVSTAYRSESPQTIDGTQLTLPL